MSHAAFLLMPAPPFRLDLTVWTLRRRPHNVVDRWDGTTYRRVLPLPGGTVEVAVVQLGPPETPQLQVVVSGQPLRAAVRVAVTRALERVLGLRVDLGEFYRFAAQDRRLGQLAQRFRGIKPPRFATVFEGLINAMACQQMTLTQGIRLLNLLAVDCGAVFGEGPEAFHAFPCPEGLAEMSVPDLRQLGFSRQKGRAMIELARAVAEGRLDLEALTFRPDDEVIDRLCELRGVGRWTAEYTLLRGLGRLHMFPGDDVGARNNLRRWLRLRKTLDYDDVRRVLARWDGYGGLVYFHLLLDRLEEAGYLSSSNARASDALVPGD
jgi:DNA-3-methyladenine glycosylase II